MMIKEKINRKRLLVLSVLAVFAFVVSAVFFIPVKDKVQILKDSPLARQFLHSWRSIKKIPDIIFVPYWFGEKKLLVYNLDLSSKDIVRMNAVLDEDIIDGQLKEANQLFVGANFRFDNYFDKVHARYRGADSNHWDSLKKSYQIKFPKSNLFNGIERLNLTIPYDRLYFVEPLNAYRAKKLGLITPQFYFVNLKIGGFDYGVYMAHEQWTPGWAERQTYPDTNIFVLDNELLENQPLPSGKTPFSLSSAGYWSSYTSAAVDFEEIKALFSVLSEKDDSIFAKEIANILDLEKFYRWDVINILADSVHQSDYANLIFIFNKVTGKFELIPWDVSLGNTNSSEFSYKPETTIAKRVLSMPQFRQRRDEILRDYVNNPKNLEDDLNYYDTLYKETKSDFFSDRAKFHNNFIFIEQVKDYRQYLVDDFNNAEKRANIADYNYDKTLLDGEESFGGTFVFFKKTYVTQREFLIGNPQFYQINANTIGLSAGPHFFRKTVIIPVGVNLVINPGAELFFDKDVSVVAHGTVTAKGNKFSPIKFSGISPNTKWGVFGVVNAPEKSYFDYVHFNGGSEALINGIVLTSQLSINNSDFMVTNSIFENSKSDDGLHAIKSDGEVLDSIFRNNKSDCIDFDFINGAVKNSEFYNCGGDSIDLSGSRVVVYGNKITGSGDKGVSVGEKSFPVIESNSITKCSIGIAVKDKSEARLINNKITNNETGVSLYLKKQIFGGAEAWSKGDLIKDNDTNLKIDNLSNFHEE